MTSATCSRDILGVVGLLGCQEHVSHFILQPKLLNWRRSHVDLLYCLRRLRVSSSRSDRQGRFST